MSNLNFSIVDELRHQGICDASAAVPLGEDHFIVVNQKADKQLGNGEHPIFVNRLQYLLSTD